MTLEKTTDSRERPALWLGGVTGNTYGNQCRNILIDDPRSSRGLTPFPTVNLFENNMWGGL